MTPPPEGTRLIQPRRFRGLATRVGVFATAVVVGIILALGFIVERTTAERAHTEFRSRSFALLEGMAVPCALDVATGNIERLDDTLTELVRAGRRDLGMMYAAFIDKHGQAVAHSESGIFGDGLARFATGSALQFGMHAIGAERPSWRYTTTPDGGDALLVSMPVVSGIRWGTLIGAVDGTAVRERIAWSRRFVFIAAAIIAVALIAAISLGMLGIIIRPLNRLALTVRELRGGDLSARTDIASHDEIGQLASGFDAMATELEAYTRELEHRVAERTAESQRRQDALEDANRRLATAVSELAVLARTDGLTGLYNRRHFMDVFQLEMKRTARRDGALVVAMLDVDHFKRINDGFGHENGDVVLREVADVLRHAVRETDIVGRYGGEEFAIVLLDTKAEGGAEVIARICRDIEAMRLKTRDGRALPPITMSAGLVVWPTDVREADAEDLLRRADEALYAAKAAGRNRVVRAA